LSTRTSQTGSFGDEPGTLEGTPALAMSIADMLAMKEQYRRPRNGGPWRQKDIAVAGRDRWMAGRRRRPNA
jgi:hypothetical protein